MTQAPPPGWYERPGEGVLGWWDGERWQDRQPAVEQPALTSGTGTNTWAMWVLAVLPLASIVNVLLQDPAGQMRRAVQRGLRATQDPQVHSLVVTSTIPPVVLVISLVLIVVGALLALADQRILRARGVVRPFPWGWGFISTVYVIGRSVVVRRRVRGSLAPLWLWIAAVVVSTVATFVIFGIAVGSAVEQLR